MLLRNEVQTVIGTKTREEWIKQFSGVDCCFTPVLSLQESMKHPLFEERHMVKTDSDGASWLQSPIRFL